MLYKYKAKFGAMTLWGAKRLQALEHGNNRLKRMLAEVVLDKATFKDFATKNTEGR